MSLKISFELSDRDLKYFRDALKHSRNTVRHADEAEVVEAIRDVLEEIRSNEPLPDFVADRLPEIELFMQMLTDDEWQLPDGDRERLLSMFIYFGDPEDILPDDIPVIGYLDDVIVVELIMQDLYHVREAYQDFCSFRASFDQEHGKSFDSAVRRDRIDRRRQQLHQRMQRRSAARKSVRLW
ncbi:MAG: YkvA family protein [Gammaproteobacteria bacterium]|nr:YkvA family protein [Gammaproteobacteria bacterium]MDH5303960.1 YkvA family protein [Gammaproteobacteria bacterium]MDH5321117.1 YkvA family protein [Gammaproteobacteria bacterium]